jgi:hypothetical protein
VSLARSASLVGLVVVNAVLIAALAGAFGPEPLADKLESPREPERVARQARPERMQQVRPDVAPDVAPDAVPGAASAAGSRPVSHVSPDGARDAAPGVAPTGATDAAQAGAAALVAVGGKNGPAGVDVTRVTTGAGRCLEMAALSEQAIERVAEALTRAGVTQVERFAREEPARWWVHLPPQPTRENVQRKLAELKRRNVTDVSLVESASPPSFTVSLGWFAEHEQAEHYLSVLREQGVRTAVLSDAPHASAPVSRPWLRVRNADASLLDRLDRLDRLDQTRRRDVVAQQLRCT